MRKIAATVFALISCSFWSPVFAQNTQGDVVLSAKKLYVAPDLPPIDNARIVMREGKIAAVNAAGAGTRQRAQCDGGIVTAGFYNSHVHFIGERFFDAHAKSREELTAAIETMLTRFGFTSVIDTSSVLDNTNVIRRRIDSGEIAGPRILTVGAGVFPAEGLPIYLAHLPQKFLAKQLMPDSPAEARRVVANNIAQGADATKLFVATPQAGGSLKRMPLAIARAAAETSHQKNKLVLVHPTDVDGVRLALDAEADVLVHTTLGAETPWPDDVLQALIEKDVAIAPTFKLLEYELRKENVPSDVAERLIATSIDHFKPFVAAGGRVIFGTDVGYMTDDDPTLEYELLARTGMTPMQILASLTTEPARLFGHAALRGQVEQGMQADFVVLDGDPAQDVRNFAAVRCVIRDGRTIYRRSRAAR